MENVRDEKKRKVPMRMCVGCRQMFEKKSLVRVIAEGETAARLDKTGRANGRGAYICKNAECLERAIKSHAIERVLKVKLTDECVAALRTEIE